MHKVLLCFLLVTLVTSCSSYQPNISVACEENDIKSSVLKWETFPIIDGSIKVYASTNPNNIPLERPIATARISEQKITITTNGIAQRMYYTMVFNDEYPVMTASRNVIVPGTQNFRDIGGYTTHSREHIIWGKVYRSAVLDSLSPLGIKVLNGLDIKTIIDLREEKDKKVNSPLPKNLNVVNIPLHSKHLQYTMDLIQKGEISSDSAYETIRKINIELIDNNSKEFKKLFKTLLNKKNYPLVIECTTGTIRTGLVTALLLKTLGVNNEIIMQDYELSNDRRYFDLTRSYQYGYLLPEPVQEALTSIYTSKGECLDATFEYLTNKYNSVDNYLHEQVGLSNKEIKQLRSILLQKSEP